MRLRQTIKRGDEAIEASGIVPEHARKIAEVASANDCVIAIRSVNKLSTELIAEGYTTKGLNVKGKTSDWGPQAGFICCDQKFSKIYRKYQEEAARPLAGFGELYRKRQEEIAKFNDKVNESIIHGHAKPVPLLITRARLEFLRKKRLVNVTSEKDGVYHVESSVKPDEKFMLYPDAKMLDLKQATACTIYAKSRHLRDANTMFRHFPSLGCGYWVMVKGEQDRFVKELLVLAEAETAIPLTADYDFFSVTPHLSRYRNVRPSLERGHTVCEVKVSRSISELAEGRPESLMRSHSLPETKTPGQSNEPAWAFSSGRRSLLPGFRLATREVMQALAQRERRNTDPELGVISPIERLMKNEINEAVGQKVVHHGSENNNPYTEVDYPVTVFTPKNGIVSAQEQKELEAILKDIILLGYPFHANRLWTQDALVSGHPLRTDYEHPIDYQRAIQRIKNYAFELNVALPKKGQNVQNTLEVL